MSDALNMIPRETLTSVRRPGRQTDGGRRENLIAVASGKGGVGKTWFSITLSQALAQKGRRVLLVDGDLGLANVDVQLSVSPAHDIAGVVSGRISLKEAITPFRGGADAASRHVGANGRVQAGIDIIAGRSGSGALDRLSRNQIESLCGGLVSLAVNYDFLVVDLAAGMNSHMAPLFRAAGKVIIVLTDDPTSITDAYAMIKFLHAQYPNLNIQLVVNLADNRSHAEKTYGAIQRACENFLQFNPDLAGFVPRDKHVTQAIRAQTALLERYPLCDAASQVHSIAERMYT
jgi:flagellar biosynthesis protein FlhG